MILPGSFYARDTTTVAKELLGCYLVHDSPVGKAVGKIVETEAYLGVSDEAAHAFRGERPYTKFLFQEPGALYIYFTHGMHYRANVVTNKAGLGEAVLLRALPPLAGTDHMQQCRRLTDFGHLTNGPAKLVQACNIDPAENGQTVFEPPTYLTFSPASVPHSLSDSEIVTTTRIGISKATNQKLRFYIKTGSSKDKHKLAC